MAQWYLILAVLFPVVSGCYAGMEPTSSTESIVTTGSSTHILAVPSLAAVRTAIAENNTRGLSPGLSLGEITMPACTQGDGSAVDFSVDYSFASTLPSWLSFGASTERVMSLTSGALIPTDAITSSQVTYTCTDAEDSTVTASLTFALNDQDDDGASDGYEEGFANVPLLGIDGWIYLNTAELSVYRPSSNGSFLISTGITQVTSGMDSRTGHSTTSDLDGDGVTDLAEVAAGTNPFVYATNGTFGGRTDYVVGVRPIGIASADFDGDGNLDLVIVNNRDDDISVYLGDGTGTFSGRIDYAVGDDSEAVAVGDVDNDGDMDIVVASNGDDEINVLINGGNANFSVARDFSTSFGALELTLGDFDEDGALDAAITGDLGNGAAVDDAVYIMTGVGNGQFNSPSRYAVGPTPTGVITVDFDRDGHLDLAVGNGGASDDGTTISVLLGNGDGTFNTKTDYTVGVAPDNLTAGDFNADGYLDIVVACSGTGGTGTALYLLTNRGNGTFNSSTTLTTVEQPIDVNAADFNGDSNVDLAVVSIESGGAGTTLSIFLGNADGTFQTRADYTVGVAPYRITIGDFDNDADLDIGVTNTGSSNNSFSIMFNQN
jgi:hypothetical protein